MSKLLARAKVKRENAENLATIAQIGDMIGLLIFPDGWENTTNLSVQFYNRTDTWGVYADSITIANNTYSKSQWRKLEKTGAVFLAYMGNRENGVFQIRHTLGFFYPSDYWCGNALYAGAMCWVLDMNPYGRKGRNYYGMDILYKEMSMSARGCYVRLVKDVQTN